MTKSKVVTTSFLRHLLAAVVVAFSPGVVAQTDDEPSMVLEEVVVTSRKREESLQEVPVAVTAFDEVFIENSFSPELKDFDKYAPNVELGTMQFAAGGMTASIRGVSFGDLERTFEPAVGVSIDGVFLGTNTGAMIDIIDIESIEILRGPQGTLFGRNTMGGTINIRRTRPTGILGGKISATFGSYGQNDYKLLFNTPIVEDKAALKLAFYSLNGDAHTKYIDTGERNGGPDKQALTASLLLTPTDNFEAQFNFDYVNDDSEYAGLVNMSGPGNLICDLIGACADSSWDISKDNGFETSYSSKPFLATLESSIASLNMAWTLDRYTLTSRTGYSDVDDVLTAEVTGAQDLAPGLPLIAIDRFQKYKQFSQELTVASDFDGRFNFVGGLYYFHSKYNMDPQAAVFAGTDLDYFFAQQKLDAYAVFAETYYNLTDATRLTVGGRYTWEEKDFTKTVYTPADELVWTCPDPASEFAGCRNPKENWSQFSPRIGIDHQFSDDVMAYVMYSSGFRSGGWSGRGSTPNAIGPYDPETLDNYEVGVRSDLLDNRLRLNATVFYMKYKDKQEEVLRTFGLSTTTLVQNAASATVKGIEVELEALLSDNLRLRSAMGVLDSGYDTFEVEGVDLKDIKNFRYAPDFTFSAGLEYTLYSPSSLDGDFIFGANYKYTDSFTTSPEKDPLGWDRDIIDSYNSVDAAVTYQGRLRGGHGFNVSLFVNDAFNGDGRLFRTLNAGAYWFGSQEPGRTWGLRLTAEY